MNNKGTIIIDLVAVVLFISFFGINAHFIKKAEDNRHVQEMIKLEPEDRLFQSTNEIETGKIDPTSVKVVNPEQPVREPVPTVADRV